MSMTRFQSAIRSAERRRTAYLDWHGPTKRISSLYDDTARVNHRGPARLDLE